MLSVTVTGNKTRNQGHSSARRRSAMGGPGHTGRTRRSALSRASAAALASLVLPLALIAAGRPDRAATIAVSGTQWGTSTCYFGATEGNVRFAVADLQDAGVSTYRVYGGMSRWEWQDDDGAYGAPSTDQIKADPNLRPAACCSRASAGRVSTARRAVPGPALAK